MREVSDETWRRRVTLASGQLAGGLLLLRPTLDSGRMAAVTDFLTDELV